MFLDQLFRTKDNQKLVPIKDVPWMMGLKAMPAPGADYYERVFLYTGETTAAYTLGVMYLCTRTGSGTVEDPYVYAWTEVGQETVMYSLLTALSAKMLEKTGYGVASGMETTTQETPDMTVNVSGGIFYKADGTRQVVAAISAQAIDAADGTKDRIDLLYKDADGAVQYLAGVIEVDAVAGARTVTVTMNAVEGDTITINGETLTAIRTTPGADEFNIGATLALTATALYTILNSNANLTAKYTITNPSDGVVLLTETSPGGGDTPGEATLTGDIDITNGAPTVSAAAVKGLRQYTITDRAEENDTVVLLGQTFTCVNGTPGANEFAETGDITTCTANLYAAIAANATISALYDVANPSAGVITLTEKTAGGGNTPGTAVPTGTITITNGDATTSAAAVAGARSYTVVVNAGHKDTVTIDAETMTALLAAAGTDQFVPGATEADTATLLYNWINTNAVLSAIFTATNPSAGVVAITETTPGGLDTPSAAEVTGTIEVTNGDPTQSVAHVAGNAVPDTPAGGAALAEINVDHGQESVAEEDITLKRVWTSPGVND